MQERRLRILTLTDLYPDPVSPVRGIFVKHQVTHLSHYTDQVVVEPLRIFPHLRIWRRLISPKTFLKEWQKWKMDLRRIPQCEMVDGVPVYYPRYSSPPRQILGGLWGFFAYPFLKGLLRKLHREQPFDLIHAHYASASGEVASLSTRWMKVPIVLSIHGYDVTYTTKQGSLSASAIAWTFRKADAIIANSSWTKNEVIRLGGEAEKIKVVHLGAEPPPLLNSKPLNPRGGTLTILSIGHLLERKGHAYVIRALKQLLDQGYPLHYVIVGDGVQKEYLKSLAVEIGIENRISFEGAKKHEEIWAYIDQCDIFVLPSWDEAFGVVYIEALSKGKVVVGCEGEGGPEDLKSLGDCIELVKSRDVDSLVLALKRLLGDPGQRRRMGEVGQQIVAEYFTWERNARETMEIYTDVLRTYRDQV